MSQILKRGLPAGAESCILQQLHEPERDVGHDGSDGGHSQRESSSGGF